MNYLFYGELRMMTELTADRSRVLRCAELYVGWGGDSLIPFHSQFYFISVFLFLLLSLSISLSVCLSVSHLYYINWLSFTKQYIAWYRPKSGVAFRLRKYSEQLSGPTCCTDHALKSRWYTDARVNEEYCCCC